ncbi:glycosyltransferase [candidate division WWE3 bacterium]|nr:glycosyltransferase [candidate division WWE3 bacterium]
MQSSTVQKPISWWQAWRSLFLPHQFHGSITNDQAHGKNVAVIIPTYRPGELTISLVLDLAKWNKNIKHIVVVDDCSPESPELHEIFSKLQAISKEDNRVTLLRTPQNRLKAGALNYGLEHIRNSKKKIDVVVTFDDDVKIDEHTIIEMVKALYVDDRMGAVCSSVRIVNKNVNLLTRLQGLEYHSFNITKKSDIGFLQGPLVMQGMLTAFRSSVLEEVGGFPEGYLIEDYYITAAMKKTGWLAGMAPRAIGWTDVPENFPQLWRQRVRWTYGGLTVVSDFRKYLPSIFQDLLGHSLFLLTLLLIGISLIAPVDRSQSSLLMILLAVAVAQFLVGFIFQIYTLRVYQDADWKDWVVRLSIIPEFFYSNVLTFVLIGSYLFYIYSKSMRLLLTRIPFGNYFYRMGLIVFNYLGFSDTWGTR